MKVTFLGVVWRGENEPLMHIKIQNKNEDEYISVPGSIKIKKTGLRMCVGTINPKTQEYIGCNNTVAGVDTQCNRCKYAYEFYKCVSCHGQRPCKNNNKYSLDYCDSPHYVYLAYFAGDKIKVGTASEMRWKERLLEQGALIAFLVAKVQSGQMARSIEKQIMNCGVAGMVINSYKMKNFFVPLDEETAKHKLLDCLNGFVDNILEYKQYFLKEPQYVCFRTLLEKVCVSEGTQVEITNNVDSLCGNIKLIVGKILILEQDGKLKMINTKKLESNIYDVFEEV